MQTKQQINTHREEVQERGLSYQQKHFIFLVQYIVWTGEPGELQSTGSQRVRYNLATKQQQMHWPFSRCISPLPICSLLCLPPFPRCVLCVVPVKPCSFPWEMWTGAWRGRRAELRLRIFSLSSLIKRGGGSMESSSSW